MLLCRGSAKCSEEARALWSGFEIDGGAEWKWVSICCGFHLIQYSTDKQAFTGCSSAKTRVQINIGSSIKLDSSFVMADHHLYGFSEICVLILYSLWSKIHTHPSILKTTSYLLAKLCTKRILLIQHPHSPPNKETSCSVQHPSASHILRSLSIG